MANNEANASTDIVRNTTVLQFVVLVVSLLAVLFDYFSNIFIVAEYLFAGYISWAITNLIMLLFSSYIVQMLSFRWYATERNCCRWNYWVHIFSIGLLHRYFCAMKLGLESNRGKTLTAYQNFLVARNDLSLLHLFEAFLQCVPQTIFQLYVLASLQQLRIYTCISVAASVASLSLALVSYSRSQCGSRLGETLTIVGLCLQTCWRLGMLTARVAAFVILLLVFQAWFLLFIGVHWASMYVWIVYQNTDQNDVKWEERCYNAVVAIIYCFCFFNLKDGRSRWRLLSYYSLIIFQNLTCLTVFLMFYQEQSSMIGAIAFSAILGGTVIGAINLALYYQFFHPSGQISICEESSSSPPLSRQAALRSLKKLGASNSGQSVGNNSSLASVNTTESKLALSDSIVIVEESDMEDIRTLQKWMHEASHTDLTKRHGVTSPGLASPELYDTASSEMSAHDYENLPAVNITREGKIRTWRGYCDIDTLVHDDSVGKDAHTVTSSTTSHDYLDSIADDYADCKTASSLHTILEESESTCSESNRTGGTSACTLVATIDQIRTGTPIQEAPGVRRTFSLLRERFECAREPPPPAAPWARHDPPSPYRFTSVKDMRDMFLRQLLTPPRLVALRRKMVSPVI